MYPSSFGLILSWSIIMSVESYEYKEISYIGMNGLNKLGRKGWVFIKHITTRYGIDDEGEDEETIYNESLFMRSLKGRGGIG